MLIRAAVLFTKYFPIYDSHENSKLALKLASSIALELLFLVVFTWIQKHDNLCQS
jgi:hypothetical protein